ncbi:MAG: hypothetical protein Unbinned80contig1000_33 [Prokaryotic dsDNA virus sp.]|nr:MAG: hypothetical protein Unbinned80contig1000_33 [Prokaryotic dsDNA virus sp.]
MVSDLFGKTLMIPHTYAILIVLWFQIWYYKACFGSGGEVRFQRPIKASPKNSTKKDQKKMLTFYTIFNNETNEPLEVLYENFEEAMNACDSLEMEEGYGDPNSWCCKFSVTQFSRA